MSDPELKRIDEYSAKWIGHDLPFIFDPDLHTVEHNDPRPEVIEKMLALATLLGAVVRGGDGEIYSSGTESEFPGHAFSMVQADNTLQSAWLAYLPVVVGLLVMLAVDHLYGTFLISLVAGSAAIFGTFLLLLAISFFQR